MALGYPRRLVLVCLLIFGGAIILGLSIIYPGPRRCLVDAAEKLAGAAAGIITVRGISIPPSLARGSLTSQGERSGVVGSLWRAGHADRDQRAFDWLGARAQSLQSLSSISDNNGLSFPMRAGDARVVTARWVKGGAGVSLACPKSQTFETRRLTLAPLRKTIKDPLPALNLNWRGTTLQGFASHTSG